jgi:hypothetical protein
MTSKSSVPVASRTKPKPVLGEGAFSYLTPSRKPRTRSVAAAAAAKKGIKPAENSTPDEASSSNKATKEVIELVDDSSDDEKAPVAKSVSASNPAKSTPGPRRTRSRNVISKKLFEKCQHQCFVRNVFNLFI